MPLAAASTPSRSSAVTSRLARAVAAASATAPRSAATVTMSARPKLSDGPTVAEEAHTAAGRLAASKRKASRAPSTGLASRATSRSFFPCR